MATLNLTTLGVVFGALSLGSCVRGPITENASNLVWMKETVKSDLSSQLSEPGALCSYLAEQGYHVSDDFAPGAPIAISLSYNTDAKSSSEAEAGQAYGKVDADGFATHLDTTTMQGVDFPGVINFRGKSSWKMNGSDGFRALAYQVVCNRAATYGSRGRLHPGYETMRVFNVEGEGGTAGKRFAFSDAIKVQLSGGSAVADVYFEKGQGFAGLEFREKAMPSGTFKFYSGK